MNWPTTSKNQWRHLALLAALPWMAFTAQAAVELRIGDVTGSPGRTVRVPVQFTADTAVVGLQIEFVFPSTNLASQTVIPGDALADHQVPSNEVAPGVRRGLVFSPTNAPLVNGVLFEVPLVIASNAPLGALSLTLTNVVAGNATGGLVQPVSQVGGTLTVVPLAQGPSITSEPADQRTTVRGSAVFEVLATGTGQVRYQWFFNRTNPIAGANSALLELTAVGTQDRGSYHVLVSDDLGAVSSREAVLTVVDLPQFTTQPLSQRTKLGSSLTLSVAVNGTPPWSYQWRLNGANIPGATNATYTIVSVRLEDSGSYTVVVANEAGALTSDPAEVTIELPRAPAGDNFANRMSLSGSNGVLTSTNRFATVEPGEPKHAGKEGGKSVWYTWRASANGIATFRTTGSSFDTLLGVYTGTAVNSLTAVGGDDDRGGYLTSEVQFNAVAGMDYQIAVDGFGGAEGDFVLSWQLEPTVQTVPVITTQPISQTVLAGSNAVFQVIAPGVGLSYQWYFNGEPLAGATAASYSRTNVQKPDVGSYAVRVSNAALLTTESLPAHLELVDVPKELSQDKLEDLIGVGGSETGLSLSGLRRAMGSPSVSVGSIGSQLLNNLGATTQAGEPNPWSAIGGASRWLRLKAAEAGVLVVDTVGSEIDTLLAVYTGTRMRDLKLIAADDNGAADGVRSLVRFNAEQGKEYLIAVDGVGGAQGHIKVNWQMEAMGEWRLGYNERWDTGVFGFRVTGQSERGMVLEATADFRQWVPIWTNQNSGTLFEYLDLSSTSLPQRFYRAKTWP
jgi:hypothetical protein